MQFKWCDSQYLLLRPLKLIRLVLIYGLRPVWACVGRSNASVDDRTKTDDSLLVQRIQNKAGKGATPE